MEFIRVYDKDENIFFSGKDAKGPFGGKADKDGKLLEFHPYLLGLTKADKVETVKQILTNTGYQFEHPTLILEGREGWFVILTPEWKPFQAIVHWDGKQADFFATMPEIIE